MDLVTTTTSTGFELVSDFRPTGDQPQAIEQLGEGLDRGLTMQTMLGATGSGKTFTMANIIAQHQRPTLVLAPNRTLAAQLTSEFRDFFPRNAVEYFVSYYDYYQPEAYIPRTDTYIAKDADINDEIDKMRHSATRALFEHRDVLIVASVSCIYGLGEPGEYESFVAKLHVGRHVNRNSLIRQLVDMQYARNDMNLVRGTFRVRGDTLTIFPAYEDIAVRVDFWGDEIERIVTVDPLSGELLTPQDRFSIYPAKHFVTSSDRLDLAITNIEEELRERSVALRREGRILEATRLEERTRYDLEMLRESGYCSGIENYSRHLQGRGKGSTPWTLLDYFPDDWLVFIDESHIAVPQVRGMYFGDIRRKETLVDFGFRLPSALDNRPLDFTEFEQHLNQVIFVSATPGPYELERSQQVAEQVIRPTGLPDPIVEVRETQGQIDDLLAEVRTRAERRERVLVTTLTKKMSEDLTDYLLEMDVKAHYLHSEIDTLERVDILRDLRQGVYDVIVGINLLREGLDLPEVSLVCILGRRQGGLPALRRVTDPDDRPRRPPRRGPRDHVRRHRHAIDADRPRRDGAAARDPARLERAARHRARGHQQADPRHHRRPARRRGVAGLRRRLGPAARRAAADDQGAGVTDEVCGARAGVRARGPAPRPDRRAAPRTRRRHPRGPARLRPALAPPGARERRRRAARGKAAGEVAGSGAPGPPRV